MTLISHCFVEEQSRSEFVPAFRFRISANLVMDMNVAAPVPAGIDRLKLNFSRGVGDLISAQEFFAARVSGTASASQQGSVALPLLLLFRQELNETCILSQVTQISVTGKQWIAGETIRRCLL